MTALRRACTAGSRSLRYLLAIFLLGGTAMGGDALATTYRIVALTIPDDAKYGDAFDINATGDVVGTITTVDNRCVQSSGVRRTTPCGFCRCRRISSPV